MRENLSPCNSGARRAGQQRSRSALRVKGLASNATIGREAEGNAHPRGQTPPAISLPCPFVPLVYGFLALPLLLW